MKPMLLQLANSIPKGDDWVYEVKYDGFRCILDWSEDHVKLISRNNKDLSHQFPEIIEWCQAQTADVLNVLPLTLDGELTILNTPIQANFPLLQTRGRLKTQSKINAIAEERPASLCVFDVIKLSGQLLIKQSFKERKKALADLFQQLDLPANTSLTDRLIFVEHFNNSELLWEKVILHLGEGIVAKRLKGKYEEGKRTDQWQKIKNWRTITGFISSFNPENGYYKLSILKKDKAVEIGSFKYGLSDNDKDTLVTFIHSNGKKQKDGTFTIPPGICVDVNCLNVSKDDLREPLFANFRFDLTPEECTQAKLGAGLAILPVQVEITNPDKPLWPEENITKSDYIIYLRQVAPYMLPFLFDKKLTVIRYPHGVNDESFYQKHRADYAPDYLEVFRENQEVFMVCNNLASLIWLGNQAALEYHIPFQKVDSDYPDEIVLDLDPPDRESFYLAIKAATEIKKMCDTLDLIAFVKSSGNKGLQIHIPIPDKSMNFEETRQFTESIAMLLVQHHPDLFTIERLKKNRGNRLYVDYIQHAEGKTIIAPYSTRATPEGTVATPLFWTEITEELKPTDFTVKSAISRLTTLGNPWANYDKAKEQQPIEKIKQLL